MRVTFCCRRSEFLGCVSFPLKDAIKSDISGTYFLQQGRQSAAQDCRVTERRKMATDNTETSTNDGAKENPDKGIHCELFSALFLQQGFLRRALAAQDCRVTERWKMATDNTEISTQDMT